MLDLVQNIQSYTFWKVLGIVFSFVISFLLYVIKVMLDKCLEFNDLREQIDKIYEYVVKKSNKIDRAEQLLEIDQLRTFLYELMSKEIRNRKFMDE